MDGQKSPEQDSPPTLNARKFNGSWYVAVTWGNGRHERLGPYKTEAVAEERIKAQLEAWHEGQKLLRKRLTNTETPELAERMKQR